MLSHLLHVQHPTAKQAVITAMDLLGIFFANSKFFVLFWNPWGVNSQPFVSKKRSLPLH